MTELKPCPFCGSDQVGHATGTAYEQFLFVACHECEAQGPPTAYEGKDCKERAAENWNRRVAHEHS